MAPVYCNLAHIALQNLKREFRDVIVAVPYVKFLVVVEKCEWSDYFLTNGLAAGGTLFICWAIQMEGN